MAAAQQVLEEYSEPMNYKKWVLKVSIHCEGCKRKVKKILQQIQGVYEIDIDAKLQKVTVIGEVGADTLLRKLNKAGKHAELWPVKVEQKEKIIKNQEMPKSKEKITTQQEINEENSKISIKNEKSEQVQEQPSKNTQVSGPAEVSKSAIVGGGAAHVSKSAVVVGGGGAKSGGECGGSPKNNIGETNIVADKVIEETTKPGEKKTENSSGAAAPAAAEKKGGENETSDSGGKVGGNDGGNGGRKKKKKGQNGNNAAVGEQSSTTPAGIGSGNHEDGPQTGSVPANLSPPRHPSYYDYPPHYYGPQPVYAVSYNTAHPASHTASYYAAPPPNSYVYAYSGMTERQPPPPPSDLDSYPRQPLDSFEIFSDENPNGCSVM
ncbi:hypothetical protein M9H77_27553 [Catharanthus roseus]|uniref:Uncharacterized protein n=1 Tax=Catharanthus roseus TaxID=4058 RepID=A0ACC0AEQ3_CATRO|nr:hypothetical protein M9H77_27553 [Catharanthus roseus]